MKIDPKTNGCEIMLNLPLPERQFSYVFMCFGTVKYMLSDQDVLVLFKGDCTQEVGSATMPELLVHGFSPQPSCPP